MGRSEMIFIVMFYGVYVEIIHFVPVNISKLVGYKAQVVFLSL
jgi:hypothetical protein